MAESLLGYHFCGIGNRRSDVFACEAWIRVQKVRFTTDFRKLAEDELNGNACLTDEWLAQHHLCMSGNTLGKNHVNRLPLEDTLLLSYMYTRKYSNNRS